MAFIGGFEGSDFEIDGDQALHFPVVKQQVELVIFTVDDHPFLPLQESKAPAQFQQEIFQFIQDGCFQVFFQKRIFQA